MFEFSAEYIEELLQGIYTGTIDRYNLPASLYYEIANYLKKGMYSGFGKELAELPIDSVDYELLAELRENIYMFSAAKTYQQTREMTDLLMDDDRVRSFAEFKEEALKVYEQYNTDWLRSEYNTAIAQGDMANKWLDVQSKKDILPNLRYSTTEVACPICAPLNDITLPVDDSFWDDFYPPNHFNCMCVVTQEDADVDITPDDEVEKITGEVKDEINDSFLMNSGKDGYVFNENSPYFTHVPKEDRDFAKENFGLPIPEKD